MNVKIPTVRGLFFRLFIFVLSAAVLSSFLVLAFYRYTLQSTLADQKVITGKGWIITTAGGLIYLITILFVIRPLFRFVRSAGRGEKFDDKYLSEVQDQALNLGPKMGILATVFFITITPLNLGLSVRNLGWPLSTLWYAVFAGIMSSLVLIPLAMNLATWIVRPIVDYTSEISRDLAFSRRAGREIGLRTKLLITFLPLICAGLLYSSLIGYSQMQTIFENFQKMQTTLVGPDKQNQLVDKIEHKSDPGIRSAQFFSNRLGNMKYFFALLIFSAIVIASSLTILASSEITRPLRVLSSAADRIKSGDLEESVRLITNDEFSELGASLNRMTETIIGQMKAMSAMVERLREGIRQLDDTANTVLAVSVEQTTGATEQSSALQEASSIASEIMASAEQIAERAKGMDGIAASTLKACEDGERKLAEARSDFLGISEQSDAILDTMRDLEGRFRETYKIVRWIEEISEQTGLLALNAALEAAGAGTHGQRFAVVADETRQLAIKASRSTKAVKELIENIQEITERSTGIAEAGKKKVVEGGQAIQETVEALKTISSLAGNTSSVVHEITISTSQQNSASAQLAASFSEVHKVTNKVEEGAKEIESALGRLRDFAEVLRATVEKGITSKPT